MNDDLVLVNHFMAILEARMIQQKGVGSVTFSTPYDKKPDKPLCPERDHRP